MHYEIMAIFYYIIVCSNEENGKDCRKEKIEKESESLSASDCQSASVVLHLKPKELKLKKQEVSVIKTMQCIGKQHQIKTLDWSIE